MRDLFACWLFALALSGMVAGTQAASPARIFKVLPHLLDQAGRHALSPSLYERDAYQARLRTRTNEVSGLRFDVQWRAPKTPAARVKLRIELRTGNDRTGQPVILEQPLPEQRRTSGWSHLVLNNEDWRRASKIVAWRATLIEDGREIADLQSFLW